MSTELPRRVSIRELREARHDEAIERERGSDIAGALLDLDQVAQLCARDSAARLEIFDLTEIVVTGLRIVPARPGDGDQEVDRLVAMRRIREPGDALVGYR